MIKKAFILTTIVASVVGFKSVAETKSQTESIKISTEVSCLADNIYFEALGQPTAGQVAVALVVKNRVNDARFPDTVCEVVYQGPTSKWWKETHDKDVPIRNRCQFSWYCDGKSDKIRDRLSYTKLYIIAQKVLDGRYDGMMEGATHYHATYVSPFWIKQKTYVAQIGDHIFYRWD